MRFAAALSFLTIIPTPHRKTSAEDIGRSVVYFPVVGLTIGLALAALNWLLGWLLPPLLVNGLLIVSLVVITGALHLDGFADTCDGIAGHRTTEERWRIMHDSRAGAFGVVGVVLLLLVKYIALSSVPANLMTATLVLMPVVSRWAIVYAIFAYPYVRPSGLGKVLKQETNGMRFAIATITTLGITLALALWASVPYFYLAGPAAMFGIWVMTVALASYLKSKLSGLTGDTYGAINEVTEVGLLLLVSMLVHNQWSGLVG